MKREPSAVAIPAIFIAGALVLFAGHARAATATADFVHNVTIANEFEIQSSRVALQKTKSPAVRAFAQTMIDDHTNAGAKFKTALQASTAPNKHVVNGILDAGHQKTMSQLQTDSPAAFDADYITAQTNAHKEAVDLFTDYSKTGEDASLKQFASDTLPTLQRHYDEAKKLK